MSELTELKSHQRVMKPQALIHTLHKTKRLAWYRLWRDFMCDLFGEMGFDLQWEKQEERDKNLHLCFSHLDLGTYLVILSRRLRQDGGECTLFHVDCSGDGPVLIELFSRSTLSTKGKGQCKVEIGEACLRAIRERWSKID